MQEPPWMPRTHEEYLEQLAEDAGPQPDEMVRLQMALDAAEHQIQSMIRENDLLQANLEIAVGGLRVLANDGCTEAQLTLQQMGVSFTTPSFEEEIERWIKKGERSFWHWYNGLTMQERTTVTRYMDGKE